MTEQDHRARVEAWLDEAQDEPTAFGKAVIDVARRRGIQSPEHLDLEPDHQRALSDHLDGIDNRDHHDLALAVALSIGLDPDTVPPGDRADLLVFACAWTFSEFATA